MTQIPLHDYLEEIDTLIDESRLGEAVAHCRHILDQHPRFVAAYRLLGKALLEQNAYADAADVFRRVLSADPEDFLAHAGLAIVHKQEDAFVEALWHMERAFEQDPYNAAIQEELKDLYGRRDGLAPEQVPLTRGALARFYVKGELYQQAVAELHDLLAAEPDRLDLQALLAEALWRDGRRVDAVELCQDLLSRLPLCVKANAIVAEVWLLTGREDGAQPFLHRLRQLTQLSRDQLRGDTPAVRAFRADGAPSLPEQVLVERLPEEKVFDAAEGAGWVQEIDFEGDEAPEDDFDWLEALQSDREEAELEVASLESEDDEEVMDWLRDVAAQGEAAGELSDPETAEETAEPDETGWLAEPELPADGEKAVTDDLPDWFDDVGDEDLDQDVDLGDTADWFSEPAAGDAGFDDEMEWEAWMASSLDEGAPPEDASDEQLQVEEVAMGTTDDHANEWEDLPDEDAHLDDRPDSGEPGESTPDEDLDWLDELKEAGEPEPAGADEEQPAAAAGDLPDWLRDEMEEEVGEGDTLDWMEEASGEESLHDDETEAPLADDLPDWLQEEDEGAATAAGGEDESLADDDLSWLDQIAAGAGEPIEEGPTLEWPETDSGESELPGDAPPEAAAPEQAVSPEAFSESSEDVPEMAETAPEATEGTAEGGPEETPDDVSTEAPEDLDDAMDWLEQMASEEEPAGELDTAAAMEAETGLDWLDDLDLDESEGEEAWSEPPSAAESPRPEEEVEASSETEGEAPVAASGEQFEAEEEAAQIEGAADQPEEEEGDGLDWLDDLDQAVGEDAGQEEDWLEELPEEDAGQEEDWLEELPEDEDLVDAGELDSLLREAEDIAVEEEAPEAAEEPVASEELDVSEEPAAEAPEAEGAGAGAEEGADAEAEAGAGAGAMAEAEAEELDWLDEIAAEEPAPKDEDLVGEEEVESLLAASEEEPPAAEEEPAAEQPEDLSDAPEDLDEAMAWLERLAAQQGASLDELPSLQEAAAAEGEEPSTTEEAPDWMDEIGVGEAEAQPQAEAPPEMDVAEESEAADEDMEWLDDLVAGEEADEDVDWLAEEETVDPEAAAEMEAAVDEDLSWLDDLEPEEASPEAAAQPETSGDADEAMAWLEEMAADEEAPAEGEFPAEPAPDEAITGLSDEIPDDPDEALSWLEQLAGAEATEAPETPVVEEQPTPAAPQDVVAARAQAEAAALHDEKAAGDEAEADAIAGPQEAEAGTEEEAPEPPAAEVDEPAEAIEEPAEPALEAPAVDEIDTAEDLELFAEDAGLDIPEDPDEAMAWLERLAARQGASLDELPTVETAEEDVETPEWIAREMEEEATEEAVAPEEIEAEEAATGEIDEFAFDEAAAEEVSEEAPAPEQTIVDEEAALEEVAPEPEEEAVPEEEVIAPEPPPVEEAPPADVVAEEPPAEESTPIEEPPPQPEIETEEPEATFAEELDDDFLGDLDEEDFDDSLPDWLKVDEGAGPGWGDAQPDVTGWLQAEEEATQYDLEVPELPADWEAEEDAEPVVAEEAPPAAEEAPAPEPLAPAATLDLDQERLESARAAAEAGDYEAAVSDYRALLDAGEGFNALIAELESQVAHHGGAATLRELLGDTYMRNGQLQKALDTYRQALDKL